MTTVERPGADHAHDQRPRPATPAKDADRRPDLLRLQRAAGNRAVAGLLAVQRCGPVPCDCSPEERAEKEGAAAPVQRAKADFEIRGKFAGAASEPSTLFFDLGERVPDAAESAKVPPLAAPPGTALTLKGTASEEGSAGVNTAIVRDRIASVGSLFAAAGHTGPRTPEVRPLAGAGNIDYRRARAVEIRTTGAVSPTPDCSGGPAPNDGGPAPNPFTTALARAHTMIGIARGKLSGPPDADTAALLTRLFGGIGAIGTVDANLDAIDGQLTNMAPFLPVTVPPSPRSGHQVVNTCDAACGAGATAYNEGDGPSAMMTLCPIFMSEPNLDERAAVLIHEGSHGTTGLTTGDQSYVWQRLITQLPPGLALSNADSYTAFVQNSVSPGSVTLGPAVPDAHAGMAPAEQAAADRSVAWLEQWLIGSQTEVSSLYGIIHESRAAGSWTNSYYEETMDFLAPAFGLRRPPPVPAKADQIGVAGIADRLQQLVDATGTQLTLTKGAAPGTTWSAGPGTDVTFGTDFFALSDRDQVIELLRAVIAALPTISGAQRAAYRSTVLEIVTHGTLGSP